MQERTRVVDPIFRDPESLIIRTDDKNGAEIERAIKRALEESYRKGNSPMRHRTEASDKDRVHLCMALYVECMEAELPIHRVSDCLSNLLGIVLEGGAVELAQDGGMWAVSGSGVNYEVPTDTPDVNEMPDTLNDLDLGSLLAAAEHNEST